MREIQRAFRANQVTHGRSFATSDRTFIGAPVAELVDAQVSGTCDRKVVEVQVLSGAPNFPTHSLAQLTAGLIVLRERPHGFRECDHERNCKNLRA